MKKSNGIKSGIAGLALTLAGLTASAQQSIQLPAPQTSGGMPVYEAMHKRQTSREFVNKDLTPQQLSNILWAAYGFNRDGKRTVPSSQNSQEYTIYVFTSKGVYVWDDVNNILEVFRNGDQRALTGPQDFVKNASVNLVYVANFQKIKGAEEEKDVTAAVNCGFIAQNVYLASAAEGLGSVIRGYVDKEKLNQYMQLPDFKKIMFAQSVGTIK
ncbi:MAG: nitroreductase family protein [Bacteroidales bacterium]|jgi:nitroreductase|nr:nitroreductase family protein [Bacteroidales bacterium]